MHIYAHLPFQAVLVAWLQYINGTDISAYMRYIILYGCTHAYRPRGGDDRIRIGYVSSDLNNHPLSHLMASVFGLHDKSQFQVRAQFRSN
jgi:Glycosyl transferase family 41